MTQRHKIRSAFRRHDGCGARNSQNIAFRVTTLRNQAQRIRLHSNDPIGNGHAMRLPFSAHVDHVRFARSVEMCQFSHVCAGANVMVMVKAHEQGL